MATGKRYYWIKLKDTFMTSDAVDFLMSQPDGANYVVLYQMLCLKTINTEGRLERQIGEVLIPYDEAKIQRDTKWFSIDTVRVALKLYQALGLIYTDCDGKLVLTDFKNLVGSETDWKEAKRQQRARKNRKLDRCKRLNQNTLMLPSGEIQHVDEKRYGGNGMLAFDLADAKCEMCGSEDGLRIHHANGYSNDIEDLYVLCQACHGKAHSAATPPDWLHHTRPLANGGQDGGQGGGHVHTDIRDKRLDIRDKRLDKDIKLSGSNNGGKDIKNAEPILSDISDLVGTPPPPPPTIPYSPPLEDQDAAAMFTAWDRASGRLSSPAVSDELRDLLAEYGLPTMLEAIRQCVQQDVVKLAYLKAVLRGGVHSRDKEKADTDKEVAAWLAADKE